MATSEEELSDGPGSPEIPFADVTHYGPSRSSSRRTLLHSFSQASVTYPLRHVEDVAEAVSRESDDERRYVVLAHVSMY